MKKPAAHDNKILPLINESLFFKKFPLALRSMISEFGLVKKFKAKDRLFHSGDSCHNFYYLKQGKILLELFVPHHSPIRILTIGPEEIVGFSWIFPPYQWNFDGITTEPTTLIEFDGARLRELCETNHELGFHLMKNFAEVLNSRLQSTRLQLTDAYASRRSEETPMP